MPQTVGSVSAQPSDGTAMIIDGQQHEEEGAEADASSTNADSEGETKTGKKRDLSEYNLDGLKCPICMDLWTSQGDHQVCNDSMLNNPQYAIDRARQFVLQNDLEQADALGATALTAQLMTTLAEGFTLAQYVSNRLLWAEGALSKERASFDAERSSFNTERRNLNSEIESLRSSHAGEIDILNSRLRHEQDEVARLNADMYEVRVVAVEQFKDSPEFDKICDQSYIEGFEYFRELAQGVYPGMDFSRFQLDDTEGQGP